jgi:hypothetical protein
MIMIPPSMADDDRVWVTRFRRWGLSSYAPILLDVLRPLGFVAGQLLTFTAPVLTTFVDATQLDQFVALLDDPERLERLRLMLADEAER